MDSRLKAMCGAYCGSCEWRTPFNCLGCKACAGKMFWGQCDKANCCLAKGYDHCGQCPKMPCRLLENLFNDREHGDNGARIHNLKNWQDGKDVFEVLRSLEDK